MTSKVIYDEFSRFKRIWVRVKVFERMDILQRHLDKSMNLRFGDTLEISDIKRTKEGALSPPSFTLRCQNRMLSTEMKTMEYGQ